MCGFSEVKAVTFDLEGEGLFVKQGEAGFSGVVCEDGEDAKAEVVCVFVVEEAGILACADDLLVDPECGFFFGEDAGNAFSVDPEGIIVHKDAEGEAEGGGEFLFAGGGVADPEGEGGAVGLCVLIVGCVLLGAVDVDNGRFLTRREARCVDAGRCGCVVSLWVLDCVGGL